MTDFLDDPVTQTANEQANLNTQTLRLTMQVMTAFDEASFTGERVFQIFDSNEASKDFSHHTFDYSMFGLSALLAIPYILKVFNKNQVQELEDFVKKVYPDHDMSDDAKRTEVKDALNKQLERKGMGHSVEAVIEPKKKGSQEYHLKFEHKSDSELKKLFVGKDWKELTFGKIVQKLFPQKFDTREDLNIEGLATTFFKDLEGVGFKFEELIDPYLRLKEVTNWVSDHVQKNTKEYQGDPDFFNKIFALSKIVPLFTDKNSDSISVINTQDTLGQRRKKMMDKANETADVGSIILDVGFYYSYAFWMFYMPGDMLADNTNQASWNKWGNLVVFSGTFIVGTALWAMRCRNYEKYKVKEANFTANEIVDKKLEHQIYEAKFIERQAKKLQDELKRNQNKYKATTKMTAAQLDMVRENNDICKDAASLKGFLASGDANEKELKRLLRKAGNIKALKQLDLLNSDAAEAKDPVPKTPLQKIFSWRTLKRTFTFLSTMVVKGIVVCFIGWTVASILQWVGVGVALTLMSPPLMMLYFVVGMFLIGGYYAYKAYQADKAAEAALREKVDANKPKIEKLKELVEQNRKLEILLLAQSITPLKIFKAHDDASARRLKKQTRVDKIKTFFKKRLNDLATVVGRIGTAIFIVRVIVIPTFIMVASHMIFAPAAVVGAVGALAVASPVVLVIAAVLILLWVGMYVVRYRMKSARDEASRLLDDIDNRIDVEKENQKLMMEQLGEGARLVSELEADAGLGQGGAQQVEQQPQQQPSAPVLDNEVHEEQLNNNNNNDNNNNNNTGGKGSEDAVELPGNTSDKVNGQVPVDAVIKVPHDNVVAFPISQSGATLFAAGPSLERVDNNVSGQSHVMASEKEMRAALSAALNSASVFNSNATTCRQEVTAPGDLDDRRSFLTVAS